MEIKPMNIEIKWTCRGDIPVLAVISGWKELGYIFKHEGRYRIDPPDGSSRRVGKGFKRISEAIGAIVTRNFEGFDALDDDLPLDEFAQELQRKNLIG